MWTWTICTISINEPSSRIIYEWIALLLVDQQQTFSNLHPHHTRLNIRSSLSLHIPHIHIATFKSSPDTFSKMQLTLAFAAMLALASATSNGRFYGKNNPWPKKDCPTTKTCKAVYSTYYKEVPTYYEKTKTETVYKPYTTTIYIDK